jgi:hypothetical protein
MEWAVIPENRHKRDACIYPYEECNPSGYGPEGGLVDIRQEYEEAGNK